METSLYRRDLHRLERYVPYVMFAVRICAALLYFQHGAQKLFGFTGARVSQDLLSQRGIAGLLETIGPTLLALGLFTRTTTFILCGEMAVAYFQSWAPVGFWPITNGGEEAILFCFYYLAVVTFGPGAWSLDGWLEQQRFWRPAVRWKQRLAGFEPYARSVLRAIVGFLVIQHGARKVFGVLVSIGGRRGVPPLALDGLPVATGYLDLVTGALLIVGLFTRPVASVVAFEMLVAYLVMAAPRGPWPISNGGGEALMHVLILAYILVAGAGAWSVDAARLRRSRRAARAMTERESA